MAESLHNQKSVTGAYHRLLSAVLELAIADLKGTGPGCGPLERDRVWYFIQSRSCESYCLELEIDYRAFREKAARLYGAKDKPRKEK